MKKDPSGTDSIETDRYPMVCSADILVGARHDSRFRAIRAGGPFANGLILAAGRPPLADSGSRFSLPCSDASRSVRGAGDDAQPHLESPQLRHVMHPSARTTAGVWHFVQNCAPSGNPRPGYP